MDDDRPDGATKDIDARAVAWVAAAIAAGVAAAALAAYAAWTAWIPGPDRDRPNAPMDIAISGPVLDSAPQPARAAYMAEKRALLERYEWVDRQAGIARIPIEQAMQMLAGRSGQNKEAQP